jgi:acetyl esterase
MINPELEPFLKVWNEKWSVLPAKASSRERRLLFEYIAESMRLPTPKGVETFVRFVPSGERNVLVRIDRHVSDARQPALVYMHGGAWLQGSPMTHADITMRIAAANRQTVVSVDYALAPEHPFPKAVHECRDTVLWLHEHADDLDIDRSCIAIGGDSAGGNLAAAVAIALRGKAEAPMAQLLIYPAVDFEMDKPSYVENADAPLLNVHGMPAVNAMYVPNPADRRNPLAAPFFAESHAGLPQAYVAVAQNDPLRDDGYAYAEKLKAAGVAVEVDDGTGLIHGYLRAMEYCAASRESLDRMCRWLAGCYAATGHRS